MVDDKYKEDDNLIDRKVFTDRLGAECTEYNVNMHDIAQALGVSDTTCSNWCNYNKKTLPTVQHFMDLSSLLNVDIEYLLGMTDEKKNNPPSNLQGEQDGIKELRKKTLNKSLVKTRLIGYKKALHLTIKDIEHLLIKERIKIRGEDENYYQSKYSYHMIYNWFSEENNNIPRIGDLFLLSRIFGISLRQLLLEDA
jgi:transcriptional regulator with XRE-family HTH domain